MKACYLLLILLISSSIEYPYEYIKDESIEEEEPILGFNIGALIGGFIKSRINSLKDPNFWIQQIGKRLGNQIQKWSEAKSNRDVDEIRDCDRRINKENNDQVVALRKEIGLPLDIRAFCYRNPECGTKIRNDYDYLDIKIFKLPPYNPFSNRNRWESTPIGPLNNDPAALFKRPSNDPKYLAVRAKVDKMYEILKRMDENLNRCIENPSYM
jgi:hypothetical protein